MQALAERHVELQQQHERLRPRPGGGGPRPADPAGRRHDSVGRLRSAAAGRPRGPPLAFRRVAFLALPQPFDFELTTERFRAFGLDRANLWHDGALLSRRRRARGADRGGGGRRRRRAARRRDGAGRARGCSGSPFDLDAFAAWAAGDEVLARASCRGSPGSGRRSRRIRSRSLVGAIIAQQVSLFVGDARSATGSSSGSASASAASWAFPSRERIASATEDGAARARLLARARRST